MARTVNNRRLGRRGRVVFLWCFVRMGERRVSLTSNLCPLNEPTVRLEHVENSRKYLILRPWLPQSSIPHSFPSMVLSSLASRATNITGSAGPLSFSTSYASTTLTSIIACATPMIALMFLAALSWIYRYSVQNPRPINKVSGYRLQRFAPCKLRTNKSFASKFRSSVFYCFLVFIGMAEVLSEISLFLSFT